MDSIKVELKERLDFLYANNRLVEAQRLEQRTKFDLEMIQELGYCNGIGNYRGICLGGQQVRLRQAYIICPITRLSCPTKSRIDSASLARCSKVIGHARNIGRIRFSTASALDNRPLRFEEWENLTSDRFVSATPGNYEEAHEGARVEHGIVRPTGLLGPILDVRPATTWS